MVRLRPGGRTVFGAPGDIPVPGDYTGSGSAQFAVFRRGVWMIQGAPAVQWGAPGDIPVPADYDGDGRVDIAVYRPSTGGWYILGQIRHLMGRAGGHAGASGFERRRSRGTGRRSQASPVCGSRSIRAPAKLARRHSGPRATFRYLAPSWRRRVVAADEDGDRRADVTIFRPDSGAWYPPVLDRSGGHGRGGLGCAGRCSGAGRLPGPRTQSAGGVPRRHLVDPGWARD